jgi:hypothetical protein
MDVLDFARFITDCIEGEANIYLKSQSILIVIFHDHLLSLNVVVFSFQRIDSTIS